jgi:hypothetical protein
MIPTSIIIRNTGLDARINAFSRNRMTIKIEPTAQSMSNAAAMHITMASALVYDI